MRGNFSSFSLFFRRFQNFGATWVKKLPPAADVDGEVVVVRVESGCGGRRSHHLLPNYIPVHKLETKKLF